MELQIDETSGPWTERIIREDNGDMELPIPNELARLMRLTGDERLEISVATNGNFIVSVNTDQPLE